MPTLKVKGVTVSKEKEVRTSSGSRGRQKKTDKVIKDKADSDQPFKTLTNMDSICRKCNLLIDEQDSNSLDCDRCHGWLHFACTGMSDICFDFLHKNKVTMIFHCDACTSETSEGKCQNESHSQMNAKLENLTGLVNILISQNKDIIQQLAKKEETKAPAPVVWPTVATTRLEKNIETKMTQVVNNQKEIDEKKCNLIVFNLPEIEETADGKEELEEDYRNVTDIYHTWTTNMNHLILDQRT